MKNLWMDIRYASRTLRQSPSFTALAILALALGIGANTAIYSVVHAVLIQELPYPDSGKIMVVWEHNRTRGVPKNVVGPANYVRWVERNTVFEEMAAVSDSSWNLTGDGEPQRISASVVTPSLFRVMGVDALLGRVLADDDAIPGAERVVLISQGLWEQSYGGDAAIIGRRITLEDRAMTIVGVVDANNPFPDDAQVWAPMPLPREARDFRGRYMLVVARLGNGVTIDEAQSEMNTIAARMEIELPDWDTGWGVNIVPLTDELTGEFRPALLVLFGAVGFVLLIACANVAGLLLARAFGRRRELAVRASLGAGRGRIIRQLLVESCLLSLVAGVLGTALAYWGVDALLAIAPAQIPGFIQVGIDADVLLFTLAASLGTGVLFGLFPAWESSRIDLVEAIKETQATTGRGHHRLRSFLIVGEISLALVLVAGAGLLVRSFMALRAVDPGFRSDNVLTLNISLPGASYGEEHQQRDFYERAVRDIAALPDVVSAGAISFLPMTGLAAATSFTLEDRQTPRAGERPVADVRSVTRNYFRAMGIPLERGRVFDERDDPDAPHKVVINRTMAETFWPDEDPLGQLVNMSRGEMLQAEVIGVVGDVRHAGLDSTPRSKLYWHHPQFVYDYMTIVARTTGDPSIAVPAIRGIIGRIDPTLPIARVSSMGDILSRSVREPRFAMLVLGVFAGVSLLLVGVGLFGLISFATAQRTREIGLRVALGAQRRQILGLVLGRGVALTEGGVAVGVVGALWLTRFLEGMLFGITPFDGWTYGVVVPLIVAVGLLATYLPARRAMNIDPIAALREE